jgi:AcrR family transcriptional regulator
MANSSNARRPPGAQNAAQVAPAAALRAGARWDSAASRTLHPDPKAVFARALEELLQSNPLTAITVADICQRCDASRSTFYRHFTDKYDLMNSVYQRNVDHIIRSLPESSGWGLWLVDVLRFLAAKRRYFRSIMGYSGRESFSNFLYAYSYRSRLDSIAKAQAPEPVPSSVEYALKVYTAGSCRVTEMWIMDGCPVVPEELASHFIAAAPASLSGLM